MTTSNSRWKPKVKKVYEILTKIFIVHNYPKLPKFSLGEENLPFQIGTKVSVKDYNTFLDRNESSGYKFNWDSGNVYIVDMAKSDHEAVVSVLSKCFDRPNNGAIRDPTIRVSGQIFHYDPTTVEKKVASDVTIFPTTIRKNVAPDVTIFPNISRPIIEYPGPPPSDVDGNPHGRIFCEVASIQRVTLWNEKCTNWMHEQYVRCVFGIKLHDIRAVNRQVHRSMTAKLWTRQIPAPPGSTPVAGLKGVSVQEWDFGTIQYGSNNPTGCTGPNIPAYQVNIPVSNVFWDPPIVAGTPNAIGYTIIVPPAITADNFVIDLYDVQQEVLATQRG